MKYLFILALCLFAFLGFVQAQNFNFQPIIQGNNSSYDNGLFRTEKRTRPRNKESLTLYDKDDKARAFIDLGDEDLTIYLSDGKPIAYLHYVDTYGDDAFNIYGFNGKHLGWFIDGIVRDHKGNVVGSITDKPEGYKAIKQIKPIKGIKQIAPIKPIWINNWSKENLAIFLAKGKY